MIHWYQIFNPGFLFVPFATKVYYTMPGTIVNRVFFVFGVRVAIWRLVKESDL